MEGLVRATVDKVVTSGGLTVFRTAADEGGKLFSYDWASHWNITLKPTADGMKVDWHNNVTCPEPAIGTEVILIPDRNKFRSVKGWGLVSELKWWEDMARSLEATKRYWKPPHYVVMGSRMYPEVNGAFDEARLDVRHFDISDEPFVVCHATGGSVVLGENVCFSPDHNGYYVTKNPVQVMGTIPPSAPNGFYAWFEGKWRPCEVVKVTVKSVKIGFADAVPARYRGLGLVYANDCLVPGERGFWEVVGSPAGWDNLREFVLEQVDNPPFEGPGDMISWIFGRGVGSTSNLEEIIRRVNEIDISSISLTRLNPWGNWRELRFNLDGKDKTVFKVEILDEGNVWWLLDRANNEILKIEGTDRNRNVAKFIAKVTTNGNWYSGPVEMAWEQIAGDGYILDLTGRIRCDHGWIVWSCSKGTVLTQTDIVRILTEGVEVKPCPCPLCKESKATRLVPDKVWIPGQPEPTPAAEVIKHLTARQKLVEAGFTPIQANPCFEILADGATKSLALSRLDGAPAVEKGPILVINLDGKYHLLHGDLLGSEAQLRTFNGLFKVVATFNKSMETISAAGRGPELLAKLEAKYNNRPKPKRKPAAGTAPVVIDAVTAPVPA